MKSLFTPDMQDDHESDMFRPLLRMRSPLSMNFVKNYILERIEEITLWQKIQHIIFQTGTFIAVIGSLCSITTPAGESKGGTMIQPAYTAAVSVQPVTFQNKITKNVSRHIVLTNTGRSIDLLPPENNLPDRSINHDEQQSKQLSTSSDVNINPISIKPEPKIASSLFDSKPSGLSEIFLPKENQTSSLHPFAELQGLAFSDHTRMYGGGVAAGVVHDWQILALHFTTASGTRDDKKDAPTLSTISRMKGETEQQFALTFGGILESGRFSTSLQVGPSYITTRITSGVKDIPASNTTLNQNAFGGFMQISAGYRITDFISANIEGLINYNSAISGGIMMSIMIHP